MPSLHVDGFTIRVIPGDHAPAHVHVFSGGGQVVVQIEPTIRVRGETHGIPHAKVRRALKAVAAVHDQLLDLWSRYHG